MENQILEKTKEYFEYFNSKDINSLSNLFSNDVQLIDWVGSWNGKVDVIDIYSKVFLSGNVSVYETSEIDIVNQKSFNLIKLKVDDELLDVIDILHFDSEYRIKKINAFKQ